MQSGAPDEAVVCPSVERLPIDFLRLLFSRLSSRDLCAAAGACRLWGTLSREPWRALVISRWRHGSGRWAARQQAGQWKQLYGERHLLDRDSLALLADLPWPVRREGALAALEAAGDDALDVLLGEAAAAGAAPEWAETRGQAGGERCPGLQVGRRYWARQALAVVRRHQAVGVLAGIARDPAASGVEGLERGAVAIAQAHYPTADLSRVGVELEGLAAELRRRLRAQHVRPGSLQALHTLNHLLFGPPQHAAEEVPPPPATPSTSASAAAPAAAAPSVGPADAPPPYLAWLAGPEGGIGLRGCGGEDYYSAANSVACDVLARRRGIPISLAALQLAVAARGGLGGRLELIGLPMRVVTRFTPDAADGAGGADAADGRGSSGSSAEVFIDVFGGGQLLHWDELRELMAGFGVVLVRAHVRPLSPAEALQRMAANLIGVYREVGDLACMRLMLELASAVSDNPRELLPRRFGVSLAAEDWADAGRCLEAMAQHGDAPGAAATVGPASIWHSVESHVARLRAAMQEQRAEWLADATKQKRRPPDVLFKPGSLMQHRTFAYRGVIVDWDPVCRMGEQWIAQMGVDALPGGGRHQPFYRVLVDTRAATQVPQGEQGGQPEEAEGRQRGAGAGVGGGGGLQGGVQPVWAAHGPGAALSGLHNEPPHEETYVAQVNIQLLVPHPGQLQPGQQRSQACEAAAAEPAAPAAAEGGGAGGSQAAVEAGPQAAPGAAPADGVPPGVVVVPVPSGFEVHHVQLGRYFEGREPAAGGRPLRYRLNEAGKWRFPED